MDKTTFLQAVSGVKGANLSATYQRKCKTRKGVEDIVEKRTTKIVRTGVNYSNIGDVIQARANGDLPADPQSLPFGQWVEFPYIIEHKDQEYFRMYPASGLQFEDKVEFLLNGQPVAQEIVEPLCLASEFKINNQPCFLIKAEDLVAIG